MNPDDITPRSSFVLAQLAGPVGLQAWMPRESNGLYAGIDRDATPRRFSDTIAPVPWWRRLCVRIGFWFLARGGA